MAKSRTAALLIFATMLLPACGSDSDTGGGNGSSANHQPAPPARPGNESNNENLEDEVLPQPRQGSTYISGHISLASTGEPYPGAWVEFTDLYGGNVHTETDADGDYRLPVPEGVYTALAGDHDDFNMVFYVAGGADNTIEIPGDTRVDFIARTG